MIVFCVSGKEDRGRIDPEPEEFGACYRHKSGRSHEHAAAAIPGDRAYSPMIFTSARFLRRPSNSP
jgi:hypothetical protein